MTNDATYKTVNVEFSHTIREDSDVEINLAEYREWMGFSKDEEFEFVESDLITFLNAGDPVYEISGHIFREDFNIEQVTFERDC